MASPDAVSESIVLAVVWCCSFSYDNAPGEAGHGDVTKSISVFQSSMGDGFVSEKRGSRQHYWFTAVQQVWDLWLAPRVLVALGVSEAQPP